MNIIDYCKTHDILYQPIDIVMKPNNKGQLKKELGGYNTEFGRITPRCNDSDDIFRSRTKYIDHTEYIGIKFKGNYGVIDVDCDTKNKDIEYLKSNTPYVLSSKKQLPHLFVKSLDDDKSNTTYNLFDMELQSTDNSFGYQHKKGFGEYLNENKWSWCKKTEMVYNHTIPIKEIDIRIFNKDYQLKQLKNVIKKDKDDKGKERQKNMLTKKRFIGGISDQQLDKVIDLLDVDMNYNDWFLVMCFYKKYLDLEKFIEFSKKSTTYECSTEEITKKFESIDINKCKINIGTIHYLAKNFNETAYYAVFNKVENLIYNMFSKTDRSMAELIKHIIGDKCVYVSMTKGSRWYYFQNHKWNQESEGLSIRNEFSTTLVNILTDCMNKSKNLELLSDYRRAIDSLENVKTKNNFLIESKEIFQVDKSFIEKLDDNPNLIGFKNGVYDLEKHVFRDGKPSDMISLSTGYDYTENVNNDIQLKIMNFIGSIVKNNETADFLLKMFSYVVGRKYLEYVLFLIGDQGRNGKSKLLQLLRNTLGDYSYSPNISTFTTTVKSSSNATPDKVKCKGMRSVISTEPEESDDKESQLKVGQIKEWSGNDPITGRDLFESPITFNPHFLIILCMNHFIKCNNVDSAFAQRLKVVEFPYKFCDNPIGEFQKQIDRSYGDLFNEVEYQQQFMIILLAYHKTYLTGNQKVETPKDVLEYTNSYFEENNIVKQFILENYELGGEIPFKYVYENFHKNNKMDKTTFSKKLIENGFSVKEVKRVRYVIGINEQKDCLLDDEF